MDGPEKGKRENICDNEGQNGGSSLTPGSQMVPPQNSHSGGSASSQSSSPTHAGGWTHTGEWTRDTCGQADTQHTWAGGHTWTRVGKWTHADTRGQVDTRGHAWAGEHVDTHRAASSPGPQSPLQLRQVGLKALAALPNALRRPGRTHKVTVCHFGSRWDVVQDQACVYFPQEEVHFTRMYANVCILTPRVHAYYCTILSYYCHFANFSKSKNSVILLLVIFK